jgi:regulator of protease activity HflC (stomatin/prohibitin superfamily)
MMRMIIDVKIGERAIVLINGEPVRWLGPGRHTEWTLFRKVEVRRLQTDSVVVTARPEELAIAPATDVEILAIGELERGVHWLRGRPLQWIGSGQVATWKVDPSARVEVLDVSGVATKPLASKVAEIADARDYKEVTVLAGCVAIRYVDGVLDEVLGPGRHAVFTVERKVELVVMDLRERILAVTGQDVMTKDRVSLRLNLSATFGIADPERVATVARDADDVLYLAVQMAAREAVTSRTLDELLEGRDALASEIATAVKARAEAVGLKVSGVGIRDLVLPGDMKVLLNKVIEARKQAEANVILRREEAAATRALGQTAELLSEQPVLMRLKELEAYKDLAGSVGQVNLVVGEGGLDLMKLANGVSR